jgi:hypothetical protein
LGLRRVQPSPHTDWVLGLRYVRRKVRRVLSICWVGRFSIAAAALFLCSFPDVCRWSFFCLASQSSMPGARLRVWLLHELPSLHYFPRCQFSFPRFTFVAPVDLLVRVVSHSRPKTFLPSVLPHRFPPSRTQAPSS